MNDEPGADGTDVPAIAVIGMAGRFPGAAGVDELWEALLDGREGIGTIDAADVLAAGGDPASLDDPTVVTRAARLRDIDAFDADFFGLTPSEAAWLDPQHRLLLEVVQHAVDDAGHDPFRFPGPVGVYAGMGHSRYFTHHLAPWFAAAPSSLDLLAAQGATSPGTLTTRVSYAYGFTGPSLAVATACSTSLVAVHLARQDLLLHRCDVALAGGVSINPRAGLGYRAVPDGPFSPSGQVRAYAADADGMLAGDGVGIVVLRRLEDALADGDPIRAVVPGSAVNNDGRRRSGPTAPGVAGQVEVVREALAEADLDPALIGYVEGHGTGTPIGDPIELAGLAEVFAGTGAARLVGSVKSNLGHLDAAAGIAGLIKTVLAVEHGTIPASLHLEHPTTVVDLATTPFRPAERTTTWPRPGRRHAGVSSFGVGGTNAHVVVSEPPVTTPAPDDRPASPGWSVLRVSGRTPAALDAASRDLAEHLGRTSAPLADVAHTLEHGRAAWPHRRVVVARDPAEAAEELSAPSGPATRVPGGDGAPVFLMPGGGTQHDRMARGLADAHPAFAEAFAECAEAARDVLGRDLTVMLDMPEATPGSDHTVFLDGEGPADGATPAVTPALVAVEYASARLLTAHGVRPASLLGHSTGHYAAALVAGVLSVADAMWLVAQREQLIREHGLGGVGVRVPLAEAELRGLLPAGCDISAVNADRDCTVGGDVESVQALEAQLDDRGVDHQRLRIFAAPHSRALDPALSGLRTALGRVSLRPPQLPVVCALTGEYLTPERATDPDYWVRHARETVRFAGAARTVLAGGARTFVELGPGTSLGKLVERTAAADGIEIVRTGLLNHAYAQEEPARTVARGLGALWVRGAPVTTPVEPGARRLSLPGYPFERGRYWVAPPARTGTADGHPDGATPTTVIEAPPPGRASDPGAGTAGRTGRTLPEPPLPPRDAVEAEILALWCDALGLDDLGVEDNFFDLGGDSLQLVRLAAESGRRLGCRLSVRRLHLDRRLTVAGMVTAARESAPTDHFVSQEGTR